MPTADTHPCHRAGARARGLTLIESMVVLALLAVLTSLGAPAFERARDRQRLRSAAEHLFADLQQARFEGIRTNRGATLQVNTGTQWCWGVSLGSTACDCATQDSCNVKAVGHATHPGLSLSSSFATAPQFDARRGLVGSSGTLTLTSTHGFQVQVSVSLLGMVSLCTPSGAAQAGAFPSC